MYLKNENFSLWADFIEREYLDTTFKELIEKNIINGATSNPAIFKNAILTSSAYKEQLATLEGKSAKEKYEALAIYDIQKAADVLSKVHQQDSNNGFVSIEVDPFLCDDAQGTIAEAKRLFQTIERENVMIKVPATEAGYEAMQALTSEGIPVNATLIFSLEQTQKCLEAFKEASVPVVISVFVSRIDRAIDAKLKEAGITPSKVGIYNAALCYDAVEAVNKTNIRTLFASTGVKDDSLRASYYVDELLACHSVNTAPIATIDAFIAGKDKSIKLPLDTKLIMEHFQKVEGAGISIEGELQQLMQDGLSQFKDAFGEILEALK